MIKIKFKRWWRWFLYKKQRRLLEQLINHELAERELKIQKVWEDSIIYGCGAMYLKNGILIRVDLYEDEDNNG